MCCTCSLHASICFHQPCDNFLTEDAIHGHLNNCAFASDMHKQDLKLQTRQLSAHIDLIRAGVCCGLRLHRRRYDQRSRGQG